jgi:hypothetical protein
MKTKKNLSGDGMIVMVKKTFKKVPDHRSTSVIKLQDALMAGLAVFKLKMPSLLKFEKHWKKDDIQFESVKNIFLIDHIPSDTQLRDILDPIPYYELFKPFKKIFSQLESDKVINKFKYHIPEAGELLVAPIDGTGYFSSSSIKCNQCLVKSKPEENPDEEGEELLYHHQMLGAGIVHPDLPTVIPFAPEPIMNGDGQAKQDCELNASKRFYYRLKEEHPKHNFLIVADSLHSKVPTLELILGCKWHFLMGVKKGSHSTLFNELETRNNEVKTITKTEIIGDKVNKKLTRIYRYLNDMYLTLDSGLQVNILDYTETLEWESKKYGHKVEKKHFTWITDIKISENNIYQLMRAGRARWKEENEVFNTLKNNGYHLKHNYGHGKENLSANFAILMSLAFLIDQVEETCCKMFQEARKAEGTKYSLWEVIKSIIRFFKFNNWTEILNAIVNKIFPHQHNTS